MSANSLILLARPAGLEPAACGFEVRRSIRLSYGRKHPPREQLACITTGPLCQEILSEAQAASGGGQVITVQAPR